ncbi:MAG: hypothetical protein RBS80_28580 [Thermoguttaceae bacterium]|jgi:hypothetical protein|nr:hypothetical protein [Thermoguttaceae bacterium]
MSHIVSVESQLRDPAGVSAACHRLGLSAPVHKTVKLFSGEATGLAVQLPDWDYPIVIDTASGEVRYDNYGGRWGEQSRLDAFLQAYAVEVVKAQSRRNASMLGSFRSGKGEKGEAALQDIPPAGKRSQIMSSCFSPFPSASL